MPIKSYTRLLSTFQIWTIYQVIMQKVINYQKWQILGVFFVHLVTI